MLWPPPTMMYLIVLKTAVSLLLLCPALLHGRPTALHALLGPLALHPALHGGRGQGGQLALPRHGHRHLLLEGGVLAGAETETGLDLLELGQPHLLVSFRYSKHDVSNLVLLSCSNSGCDGQVQMHVCF